MRNLKVAALVCSISLFADGAKDFNFQVITQYLFPQPAYDAKTAGMAGSSQYTDLKANLVTVNPALTGLMKDAHASVAYNLDEISWDSTDIELEANTFGAYISLPVGPYSDALPEWGNVTVGWRGDWAEVDAVNSENEHHAITLGYAKAIDDTWALGYSATYHRAEIDGVSGKNQLWRHALGTIYKVADQTHLGIAGHYTHSTDSDLFAGLDMTAWGVGLGVQHRYDFGLTTSVSLDYGRYDLDIDDAQNYNIRVGGNYPITDMFSVRGGYRYFAGSDFDSYLENDSNVKFSALSGGLGVHFENWGSLAYALEYKFVGVDDLTHTISYDIPFSICN